MLECLKSALVPGRGPASLWARAPVGDLHNEQLHVPLLLLNSHDGLFERETAEQGSDKCRLCSQTAWFETQALSRTRCLTLGKLLTLFESVS